MKEITLTMDEFMELARKAAKYDLIAEIYDAIPSYTRNDFISVLTGKGVKEDD